MTRLTATKDTEHNVLFKKTHENYNEKNLQNIETVKDELQITRELCILFISISVFKIINTTLKTFLKC